QVTIGGVHQYAVDQPTEPITISPPEEKPTEDTTSPTLVITPSRITAGETITATSSEDGTIYLMPSSVPGLLIDLDLAVRDEVGISQSAVANQPVEFPTSVYMVGAYYLIASDAAGNLSGRRNIYF